MQRSVASGREEKRGFGWRRILLYPLALVVGALAALFQSFALFFVFAALMLAPLVIKLREWAASAPGGAGGKGGLRGGFGLVRLLRWFFRRRLRVTREGKVFMGLTVLFGVAAINTGTNLLYLILAMLLSLIVISGVLSELDLRGLRVSRRLPSHVFAGEDVRVHVAVLNPRRHLPALAIEVQERSGPFGPAGSNAPGPKGFVFKLDPGERAVRGYRLAVPRRGAYALTGIELATRYPFGFFVKYAQAELKAELVVYPTPRELAPDLMPARGQGGEVRMRRPTFTFSPDEFHGLRDYRAGDNPRWIHWRSSARLSRLVVKEFEPRRARRTAVVLDPFVPPDAGGVDRNGGGNGDGAGPGEPPDRVLDRGVTLAVSLLDLLARRGERVEVATLVPGPVRFDLGVPRTHYRVLDTLARLGPLAREAPGAVAELAAAAVRDARRTIVVCARDSAALRKALPPQCEVLAYEKDARYYADGGRGRGRGRGRDEATEATEFTEATEATERRGRGGSLDPEKNPLKDRRRR